MTDYPNLSEPVPAEEAHAFARAHADDADSSVVLMPTPENVLDSVDPEGTLESIRVLNDGLRRAIAKAVLVDLQRAEAEDDPAFPGVQMGATALTLENALVRVYGEHPRALARCLMQLVIDTTLDELLGDDEADLADESNQ